MVRPAGRRPGKPGRRPVEARPHEARSSALTAEAALLDSILEGRTPPGSILPGERELAEALSVTRPTLREALKRLERDGWIRIRQGRSTEVVDFLKDGGLNVLPGLLRSREAAALAAHAEEVRQTILPTLLRLAIERDGKTVVRALQLAAELPDSADSYAAFERGLHRTLAVAAGNPVFALVLNGLAAAPTSFESPQALASARQLHAELLKAARKGDGAEARKILRDHQRSAGRQAGRTTSRGGRAR